MAALALLLNASFEPLTVVSDRRAVVLILTGKAEVVEPGKEPFRSASTSVTVPLVVRLLRYVRAPFRRTLPISRRSLFARDGGRCAYCDRPGDTIYHVVPRSRGGRHVWENIVTACRRCNGTKDDKLLAELGWTLKVTPKAPAATLHLIVRGGGEVSWAPYLAAV